VQRQQAQAPGFEHAFAPTRPMLFLMTRAMVARAVARAHAKVVAVGLVRGMVVMVMGRHVAFLGFVEDVAKIYLNTTKFKGWARHCITLRSSASPLRRPRPAATDAMCLSKPTLPHAPTHPRGARILARPEWQGHAEIQ